MKPKSKAITKMLAKAKDRKVPPQGPAALTVHINIWKPVNRFWVFLHGDKLFIDRLDDARDLAKAEGLPCIELAFEGVKKRSK